ncbi:head GIN domain-containing protein [soil metagenome]
MEIKNIYTFINNYSFSKIKNNFTTALFSCLVLLLLLSCNSNPPYIKGNGQVVSEARNLNSFQELDIHGNYEVYLYRGAKEMVKVEADENIVDYIITEVKDGKLKVFDKESIKSKNNIKLYITYNKLKRINSGGAANIVSGNSLKSDHLQVKMSGAGLMDLKIEATTLDLNLSGAGLINLSGTVENQNLHISGAGNLDAYRLKSKDCDINLSGIGGAQIFVEDNLNAHLSGVGGIRYKGNPLKVNREVAGLGRINQDKD